MSTSLSSRSPKSESAVVVLWSQSSLAIPRPSTPATCGEPAKWENLTQYRTEIISCVVRLWFGMVWLKWVREVSGFSPPSHFRPSGKSQRFFVHRPWLRSSPTSTACTWLLPFCLMHSLANPSISLYCGSVSLIPAVVPLLPLASFKSLAHPAPSTLPCTAASFHHWCSACHQ